MILHHIQTSPEQGSALKTCLRYASPSDSLLLSANGVNALLKPQWREALSGYNVMLLGDDVAARGLQSILGHYPNIDYDEFVIQTLKHQKVISW